MNSTRLAWGILGTGHIARQFAAGLQGSDRGTLVAVGSRRLESARQFAADFNVPASRGSYEELLADPAVQALYVSLPNALHYEWTLRALRAGKHVLCEKPLATDLGQAREMFDTAQREGRLLAEAFMYRSHPLTHAVEKALADGAIGRLRVIRTSFLFASHTVAGNIRFDPALAGGALMDVGCYCLSYSRLFAAAEPTAMAIHGHIHPTGVDDYAAGSMAFPGDIVANFACGITICADNTASLLGTEGYIEIPLPWKPPVADATFTCVDAAGRRQVTRISVNKHLYALEADEFAAAVLDGVPPRVSRAESLGNQACLDELRRQLGLAF